MLLGDDEAAPSDGSARLRIYNAASADAGAVDAYLSPAGCTSLGASNAVASNVTAAAVGAWATVGAAAGGTSYHLCVTGAGDTSDLRLDLSPLTLGSRQVTTVVVTASAGAVLVNALTVDQQGAVAARANPSVRVRLVGDAVAHASVGAIVNRTALDGSATPSPTIGRYTLVAAGDLAAVATIGGAAVPVAARTAAPGADLTLLVAGSAAAPTVVWLPDDNHRSTATATPVRLRLVHGINALADSLSLRTTRTLASGVTFATASAPASVASGAVALAVSAAGSTDPLYATTSTTATGLESGGVYTLFMLGDAGSAQGLLERDR